MIKAETKGFIVAKIRASSLEIFRPIFFIMGLTLGEDSVIQAPKLLSTLGCTNLAPNEYIKRHNYLEQYIHTLENL